MYQFISNFQFFLKFFISSHFLSFTLFLVVTHRDVPQDELLMCHPFFMGSCIFYLLNISYKGTFIIIFISVFSSLSQHVFFHLLSTCSPKVSLIDFIFCEELDLFGRFISIIFLLPFFSPGEKQRQREDIETHTEINRRDLSCYHARISRHLSGHLSTCLNHSIQEVEEERLLEVPD